MSCKIKHKCAVVFAPLLVIAATLALPAQADTLLIDKTLSQSPDQVAPRRGMSMQQIETRFGPPYEIISAVGEPPITRWVYKDFVVYFEREYVIHSVMKRK